MLELMRIQTKGLHEREGYLFSLRHTIEKKARLFPPTHSPTPLKHVGKKRGMLEKLNVLEITLETLTIINLCPEPHVPMTLNPLLTPPLTK